MDIKAANSCFNKKKKNGFLPHRFRFKFRYAYI